MQGEHQYEYHQYQKRKRTQIRDMNMKMKIKASSRTRTFFYWAKLIHFDRRPFCLHFEIDVTDRDSILSAYMCVSLLRSGEIEIEPDHLEYI